MPELIDATGLALADVRKWLPARVSDWPTPPRIVDKHAAGRWRQDWIGRPCWFCGQPTTPVKCRPDTAEVHHIVRHDAPWAFAHLCATCHRLTEDAVKQAALGQLIRLKHQYDRDNTQWIMLHLAKGYWLP